MTEGHEAAGENTQQQDRQTIGRQPQTQIELGCQRLVILRSI